MTFTELALDSSTLDSLLRSRALHQPHDLAYTFLSEGEAAESSISYLELDQRARAIGSYIQSLGLSGKRILLCYPPGLDYIAAFFGCLYAGAVAVPAYPPRLNASLLRLQAIIADAQVTAALAGVPAGKLELLFSRAPELKTLQWIPTDHLTNDIGSAWREPVLSSNSTAFLQYSSGSTGTPKGVILTHGNLLSNASLVHSTLEHTSDDRYASWLPLFHDMGFMAGILQPLYGGFPAILMSPLSFLKRPIRWLQAISHYRVTTSGGPNFAYDLCVRKISAEQKETVDLSSWKVAFNGAEPIHRETLERFVAAFEPLGFRRESFYPCYGLAEATLMVSGGLRTDPPVVRTFNTIDLQNNRVSEAPAGADEARALVGCGKTLGTQRVIVVHPELMTECSRDEVGEIWVSGPSVAQGYWNRKEETAETFHAYLADTGDGPFLRTGDLGFLHDRELFVTGRIKDVIIIRGHNHYPQDIELTVEKSAPSLRRGCGAAFSVEIDGEERLVVVQEVERRLEDMDGLVQRIRQAVSEEHELQVYSVVLVKRGSIPKTSSNKIQRNACRARFLTNTFSVIASWQMPDVLAEEESDPPHLNVIEDWLAARICKKLRIESDRLDVTQNISRYGLDSLQAIELTNEIEVELGLIVPMTIFLQDYSISQLATLLRSQPTSSFLVHKSTLAPARERVSTYPLSYGQRALWLTQQQAPDSPIYNIARATRIKTRLDVAAFRRACQLLMERHGSLRTTFSAPNGEPVQQIHGNMELLFQEIDARGWTRQLVDRGLLEEANRVFNLERGPLIRVNLLTCSDEEQILLLVIHHIVADLWSMELLLEELAAFYAAETSGTTGSLPPHKLEYTDYTRWQIEMLAGPTGEQLWSYWKKRLSGHESSLNLPAKKSKRALQTYRGASHTFELGADLSSSLTDLSYRHGATVYTTLLAAFQVLLSRYTGQDQFVIGSPASGRSRADLRQLVGYLVNPLALRADVSGDPPFETFLQCTRESLRADLDHQDFPFALLVEKLKVPRDPGRSPLFQVMFVFQRARRFDTDSWAALTLSESGPSMTLGELTIEPVALDQFVAQLDLTLMMVETSEGLKGSLLYNSDLFDRPTVVQLAEHFRCLLESIVAKPAQRLSELSILSESEWNQLLATNSETRVDYSRDQCMHELFEVQAQHTPHNVAISFADQEITYAELNRKANQVAHYLRRLGVTTEACVGLCVERSPEMIVGLLGILKAGGAYVPLDPGHPSDRLAFLISDAKPGVILTKERLLGVLPKTDARLVCLDSESELIALESEQDRSGGPTGSNLAYVIYTSGTTGEPKGVLIEHGGVCNLVVAQARAFDVQRDSRILQLASLSFDASVFEICMALGTGAALHIVPKEIASGPALVRLLREQAITHVTLTPSILATLPREALPELSTIIVAGDVCTSELVSRWAGGRRFFNAYGPTETTVWATVAELFAGEHTLHIGRPIANTKVHLLDGHLQPVPIGVKGELFIGGDGLARGYLNRPELTVDSFIPDPFSSEPGQRLYRTGDLARYLPDGNIEFLGRNDRQVKIRGIRIELGEIEEVLRKSIAVRDVAVVVHGDESDDKALVAYIVPGNAHRPTVEELRRRLEGKLPKHSILSAFVLLDELPLTRNGKVDLKALPRPERSRILPAATYVSPSNELERVIASVWREILKLDKVSVHENVFDLGGHSLLLAQIQNRLQELLRVDVSLVDMFSHPTISALAAHLSSPKKQAPIPSDRVRDTETRGTGASDIAIIGMAGRFPGAKNVEEFWQNLCAGVESISFFSDEELEAAGVERALLNDPHYVKAGAVLNKVELFAADFFGFTPREAELMDPQHRVFLECAWEALENAGYNSDKYEGRIGVYAGSGMSSYLISNLISNRHLISSTTGLQSVIANDKDFVATRVSYKLNLKGPSVTIQTACSTSLVAVHMASQSLLHGECEMALAGGVSIRFPHQQGYLYQEGGILSPDGHCRAFDAKARGTIGGHGVGLVVLKRLAAAIADGDTIQAVIKGSAINNDGSLKVGYTAPSVSGQVEVITAAHALAGLNPETISYIEAHGTGTELGDPVEVTALTNAFRKRTELKSFCALGSVKTNIGHLDAAAGVAGLIKTVLALKHKLIPPSINFEEPNPQIDFANSPFYVNTRLASWAAGPTPRRAAVSSLGIGGTNAHVVLEEAPAPNPSAASKMSAHLFVLSAKSSSALEETTDQLLDYLRGRSNEDLADIAFTLQVGRRSFNHRRMFVGNDRDEILRTLEARDPNKIFTAVQESSNAEEMAELRSDEERVLLEIGPEPADSASLLGTLGRLWLAGVEIDWSEFYAHERRRRVPLPSYPFERKRYWIDPKTEKIDGDQWFYVPSWKQSSLGIQETVTPEECWLIFADSFELGAQLAERLRQRGSLVVTAMVGKDFNCIGQDRYEIDAENSGDYKRLLHELQDLGRVPDRIVHLWSIRPDEVSGGDGVEEAQRLGFYSLLFLAQALGTRVGRKLYVVTNGLYSVDKTEALYPERATILGPCRVIPQEYPNIACRNIDVVLSPSQTVFEKQLTDRLFEELTATSSDTILALREDRRFVQRFERTQLSAGETRLRNEGVYLITGGLGGIGLSLAKHLVQTVKARVVLSGRTELPPRNDWNQWLATHDEKDLVARKIRKIQELQNLGGDISVVCADVANAAQMRNLIAHVIERFGALHGVIHAAGVNEGGVIQAKTPEAAAKVLAPKLYGTLALESLLKDVELDFLVLCSSLNSVKGMPGQVGYCAANAVLDTFAHRSFRAGTFTVSINWDVWQEVGMAVETRLPAQLNTWREEDLRNGIRTEDGIEAFSRILSSATPQVLVSTRDLSERIIQTDRALLEEPEGRETSAPAHLPATNELEQKISGIWKKVIGVEHVGIYDNFFDLGGDSFLSIEVVSELQKELNIQLPVSILYEEPTINALTKFLQATVESAATPQSEPQIQQRIDNGEIAIIGMSGRFPGAKNVEEFWQNLCAGVESISFFSDEELEAAGVERALLNDPHYVKAGAVLNKVELFDAGFFGFTPREAELMDPQHRVFLECAWEALENAGYNSAEYEGRIGVYAGSGMSSYLANINSYPDLISSVGSLQAAVGNENDALTTSVSYKLNLKGPSVTIQTACSTSLVAVHMASQSLLHGECEMALAGGVSIRFPHQQGYLYQEGGILSPDGHCRAFDAKARGTIGGHGVGLVVLKRLAAAIADGDTIHAVIKGSAINNDGSLKVGYTAPSVSGQVEVITAAHALAGLNPETISYIEAHGTGTELGDSVEIAALTKAFRKSTESKSFCALGSVKTNLGHLDRAAGVAGLIKTVLALKHKLIPPSINFEEPNPQIDFANSPFYVNTTLSSWAAGPTPRRAAVSSLGLGGTNAHVVLEEAPAVDLSPEPESRSYRLLTLSAKTETALEAATQNLAEHLKQNPALSSGDLAFTLNNGRTTFNYRRAVVYQDLDDAITALETLEPRRVFTSFQEAKDRPVVFMFPGGGSHYLNMGAELYEHEATYRNHIDTCTDLLKPRLGRDLRACLYASEEQEALELLRGPLIGLPALFATEYALAKLWISWGVYPAAMIGHSLGEYVAACLAGVFTLQEALTLVALRGELMQKQCAGAMLSVPLSEAAVQPFLTEEISLAAINGPSFCVLSGHLDAITALEKSLREEGLDVRRLAIDVAAHSHLVTPMLDEFGRALSGMRLKSPRIPYISNVTGTWIKPAEAMDPNYWIKHLRQTVRFSEGVKQLLQDSDRVLLEVGPAQALCSLVKQHPNNGQVTLSSLRHPHDRLSDLEFLMKTVGHLWLSGTKIAWSQFQARKGRNRVPLPTYPFERRRYFLEPRKKLDGEVSARKNLNIADWFYIPSWKRSMPPKSARQVELTKDRSSWLVFIDESNLGAQMVRRLLSEEQDVVTVTAGSKYQKDTDRRAWQINPQRRDDYELLLGDLLESGAIPKNVIHFWSVSKDDRETSGAEYFQAVQFAGFYSLVYLVQALARLNVTDEIHISVVSNNMHDVSGDGAWHPEKATVLGPCKVIPQEHLNITCQSIDVSVAPTGSPEEAKLIDRLLAEVRSRSSDPAIAYRGNQRWVQTFEKVKLEAEADVVRELVHEGVYLITGGLGRVGLHLAEYLARTVRARLVLLGRTAFPERADWDQWLETHDDTDDVSRKIRRLLKLETLGARVLVLQADVADYEQMQKALTRSENEFGKLRGVLHTAGVRTDFASHQISEIDRSECELQFRPKVYGLYVLEKLLQQREVDFCILFSSNAAVLGGLGFVAYSAANLFTDSFASHRNRDNGTFWISANWDGWLVDEKSLSDGLQTSMDYYSMTPVENVEAFRRVVTMSTVGQVVVSTGNLSARLDTWIQSKHRTEQTNDLVPTHARPELRSAYVGPRNTTEEVICQAWAELLGIDRVGISDNFFELGGHSLLGTQLMTRLRTVFQIDLPLRNLFEDPTVENLALEVARRQSEQKQATIETINKRDRGSAEQKLLSELDGLSDKDVDSLFHEMLTEEMHKGLTDANS